MSWLESVLVGKCPKLVNVLVGKSLVGKCLVGKCLVGKCLVGKRPGTDGGWWWWVVVVGVQSHFYVKANSVELS